MNYYRIVNLLIASEEMPDRFAHFRIEEPEKKEAEAALQICYRPLSALSEPFAGTALKVNDLRIGPAREGWIFEDIETGLRMRIPADYSMAELSEEVMEDGRLWAFLLQLFIEGRLLDEGVLTLHSCCVQHDGRAYAFSGPSGCGKSTRARQWVQNLGADYISGDRPAVDIRSRTAYGIPWDGKERIFRNVHAEVGAIFEVRRSRFTRLRKLSKKQARDFLISQIYFPMWDSERAMEAMFLLNQLTASFPVYRLFCDRDEKAAIETGQILWEHPEQIREERLDMKLKEGFVLKSMAGEHVLMPTGENIASFNGTVLLNELSAFIIQKMENGPVTREDLADLVVAEYDVSKETVLKDLDELTAQLSEMGILSQE